MRIHAAPLYAIAAVAAFSVESAVAADLTVKAPPLASSVISPWDGLYASLSAGASWTKADEFF